MGWLAEKLNYLKGNRTWMIASLAFMAMVVRWFMLDDANVVASLWQMGILILAFGGTIWLGKKGDAALKEVDVTLQSLGVPKPPNSP